LPLAETFASSGSVANVYTRALLAAAAGLVFSLLWDFSWELTVGLDLVWSRPHIAIYLAVAIAGGSSLALIFTTSASPERQNSGIKIAGVEAPLGAWICLWGALAFVAATLFDRWWQSSYGLVAGLWHPPQILKTVAFFAIAMGAWLLCLSSQNRRAAAHSPENGYASSAAAGLLLALITVVSLTSVYPNRQHSALFYRLACSTYPLVLGAVAIGGRARFPTTIASVVYMAAICLMVWLLPLFPAKPQVAPIYNSLDHLMPPPFPLLLVIPALAIDLIVRFFRRRTGTLSTWLQGAAAGLSFFVFFIATQWVLAEFLLSDLADNWFFAGGGKHWPFFLKIDAISRTSFWDLAQDRLTLGRACVDALLAIICATIGLWIGRWMKTVRR